jgi:AcrR family transcriptional regulator
MPSWPVEISIDAFRRAWTLEGGEFWRSVFDMHKDKMQIKNPKVAIVNLEKIFRATFHLANSKGFQSMSLRDLSKKSGISMGGLYAYIGSKNDLASVIAGVQRKTIEQVIGGLARHDLEPVDCLRAIIYGEIYMTEILHPWYYFCFMELKGLPKEQQQQTLDLEIRFEGFIIDTIRAGEARGMFSCEHPELLAAQVTAQLQQWHLKPWKFKLLEVNTQQYAQYVFENLLLCLRWKESNETLSKPDIAASEIKSA